MKSTCSICDKQYEYSRAKGHCKKKCNSCLVNIHRIRIKAKCLEYKGGECEICGYNKSTRALSFHHIDSKTKSFSISGSHTRAWKLIQVELDKCQLLCANCHMEQEELSRS